MIKQHKQVSSAKLALDTINKRIKVTKLLLGSNVIDDKEATRRNKACGELAKYYSQVISEINNEEQYNFKL